MARYRIALTNNQAYQSFYATLSGRVVQFRLSWLTLYGFYAVDLYENGQPLTLGRGLHPGVNIVEGLLTGLGSITLEGHPATVANLGVDNTLVYNDG